MKSDHHRPRYHLLPAANWMNDPNGLIQWNGDYHMFYQYNPHGPFHGTIHWAHGVSRDLVHWEDWGIALAPTPGGPDKDGCFSGCAVNNGGVPTLVYTGISPEVQCVAISHDGLKTWEKPAANPVIDAPPAGLSVTGFRDPFLWREDDLWYGVIGSGVEGEGGTLLLYRSSDLLAWDYLGRLCDGDPAETGTMWECPNFFPLGDKHVLLISPIPLQKSIFAVGRYADQKFTPEFFDALDDGGYFYAPQVMQDERGRWLMWGWLWEGREQSAARAAGWNGVMSLPRVLTLQNGTLHFAPAPELQALRTEHWQRHGLQIDTRGHTLDEIAGAALEIRAVIEPGTAERVELHVACAADRSERTVIGYHRTAGTLFIDRSHASLDPVNHSDVRAVPLDLAANEALDLHVFLDHSILEVFANGHRCLSSRLYPSETSIAIDLVAEGGSATRHAARRLGAGPVTGRRGKKRRSRTFQKVRLLSSS